MMNGIGTASVSDCGGILSKRLLPLAWMLFVLSLFVAATTMISYYLRNDPTPPWLILPLLLQHAAGFLFSMWIVDDIRRTGIGTSWMRSVYLAAAAALAVGNIVQTVIMLAWSRSGSDVLLRMLPLVSMAVVSVRLLFTAAGLGSGLFLLRYRFPGAFRVFAVYLVMFASFAIYPLFNAVGLPIDIYVHVDFGLSLLLLIVQFVLRMTVLRDLIGFHPVKASAHCIAQTDTL